MSHEIETAVFSAADGAGWTGLGLAIPSLIARDPAAIAKLCNADWTVAPTNVYVRNDDGSYSQVPGHAAQRRSDSGSILSITSDNRYHVDNRQPRDVFEAFRDELAAERLEISHAAVLRGGKFIAVSAILPPEFDTFVNKADRLRNYVTLSTGYDAQNGTKCTRGTIRVVCANTLQMSLDQSTHTGQLRTIRASTAMEYDTLKDLVANVKQLQAEDMRKFDALANARMSATDVSRFFADVLEINIEDLGRQTINGRKLVSTRSENMLKTLAAAYQNGPGAMSASGSAWGALNAVTYFATHQKSVRDTEGDGEAAARAASNMLGDSKAIKQRALLLATKYANQQLAIAA